MLQFGIYTQPGGQLLWDFSGRARGLKFSSNEHGFQALSCFVPLSQRETFQVYDRPGLPHAEVNWNGMRVWEGRLEDVAITGGGVRLGAYGGWRAYSDTPYIFALWSDSSLERWEETGENDLANRRPAMYSLDKSNRLFIGLREGQTYANVADVGDFHYPAPHTPQRKIQALSFNYEVLLPVDWRVVAQGRDEDFTNQVDYFTLDATGVLQSGSQTLTFAANERTMIHLIAFNNTGGVSTFAGDEGSNYAEFTNVRIKTTTTASVYADEIVKAMISYVAGLNPDQVTDTGALVQSPAVDLLNELYENLTPAEIMTRLAAVGDNQTPPRQWEVGVWEGLVLHYRPRGEAGATRHWYIDLPALELERTLSELWNSAYAVYDDGTGRPLRTGSATDAWSAGRFGLIRRTSVPVDTTSATQATVHRDAFIEDRKDPLPRAAVNVKRLYDASGSLWPAFAARAGDTFTIRNLPPTLSSSIDKIRTFRSSEIEYDVNRAMLKVTPERPLPTLDTLVAREEAGLP